MIRRRVRLERLGLLELGALPEDALDALRLESTQRRLALGLEPRRQSRRCAFLDSFSLHANTRVHPNDRRELETLRRYSARGALSLERMKRPAPDGATHLALTSPRHPFPSRPRPSGGHRNGRRCRP